jgi:hypothetical protein
VIRRTSLKRSTKRLRTRKPLPRDEQAAKEAALILLWGRACIPHGFIVCEVGLPGCAELSEVKLDPHHRLKQSQGGPWEVGNLIAACRPCHEVISDTRAEYYREGWLVRSGGGTAKLRWRKGETPAWELTPVLRRGVWVWLRPDGRFAVLGEQEIREWAGAA